MIFGATRSASAVALSSTLSRSSTAPLLGRPRSRSSRGRLCGSIAEARPTAASTSPPARERSKPFGTERNSPSASTERGARWTMSISASSFSTRLRGTSRPCASRSRQAASSISTASSFGLRTRAFSRSQAFATARPRRSPARSGPPSPRRPSSLRPRFGEVRLQREEHVAQVRDVRFRVDRSAPSLSGRRDQSVKREDLSMRAMARSPSPPAAS
jgi:hypothetical protein